MEYMYIHTGILKKLSHTILVYIFSQAENIGQLQVQLKNIVDFIYSKFLINYLSNDFISILIKIQK